MSKAEKNTKKRRSALGSTGSVSKNFNDGMLVKEKRPLNDYMRVVYIDPKKLKPNPLNREYFKPLPSDEYEKLKKDIQERGMQDPLQVKNDHTLLAGENRLNIALELRLVKVPVVFKSVLNKEEELDFILNDNILRRQLTPDEKKNILRKRYGDKIYNHGGRGGDRSSEKAKNEKSKPFAEKVAEETGLPKSSVRRFLSEIREENKELKEQKKLSPSPFDRLEKQLNSVKKTINKSEIDTRERTKILAALKELITMVKKM